MSERASEAPLRAAASAARGGRAVSARAVIAALCMLLGLIAPTTGRAAPEVAASADPGDEPVTTAHYLVTYDAGLAGTARRVAGSLEEWHARIYGELGATATGQTTIHIADDERGMFAAVARRHPGSHPPEWAAGLAFPARRTIFLRADVPAEELLRTTQHEISHVALGAATGDDAPVPIWLSEGLAIRQSEPVAFERIWLMTEAAFADALLPLSELDQGYPKGGGRVGIGYAQSVHFVGYLFSQYGEARFHALLRALQTPGTDLGAAMATAYGKSLDDIEAAWRGSLSFWWGFIPMIFLGTSFWAILGLLLVWAWRRRRREQARRIRHLAGLEAVDMAEDIEIAHNLRPPPDAHDPYSGRPPSIH